MHYRTLILLSLFISNCVVAQPGNVGVRFDDKKTELSGYKDSRGNIMIPAKFGDFTRADTFHNIIAVQEEAGDKYRSYYLLKDGRTVGKDSVYVFDFTYDCENEGKILFKDYKTNRVGFLNKDGQVIIPAMYNDAHSFYNGISLTIRNAKKKCWGDGEDTLSCEHWSWSGGEVCSINEKNEVLIKWDDNYGYLNWHSMKVNDPHADSSLYEMVKGTTGDSYSFLNYEKEFEQWFHTRFLPAILSKNAERIKQLCLPEITCWYDKGGWKSKSTSRFLQAYPPSLLYDHFRDISRRSESVFITYGDIGLIKNEHLNARFRNACGEHFKERYPVFEVVKTFKNSKSAGGEYQEHLSFVRTDEGYRMFNVSLIKANK